MEMRGNEIVNGHPIRCYDSGPAQFDRYAVYFMDCPDRQSIQVLGMSECPFHPQGFGQHSSGMIGAHNGRRIRFDELPADCQKAVLRDLSA